MARTKVTAKKMTAKDESEDESETRFVVRADLPDGYAHALLKKLVPLQHMFEPVELTRIKTWILGEDPMVPVGWIGDDWRIRSLVAISEVWELLTPTQGVDAVEAVLDAETSSAAPKQWWVRFPGIKPEKKEGDGPDNPPAPPKDRTERPRYCEPVSWTRLGGIAPDETKSSQEDMQKWIATGGAQIDGCFIARHATSNGSKDKCVVQCVQHQRCGMGWVIKSTNDGPWEVHGRKVTGPAGWDGARHYVLGVKEEKTEVPATEDADGYEKAAVDAEAEAEQAEAIADDAEAEAGDEEQPKDTVPAPTKAAEPKKKKQRTKVAKVCPHARVNTCTHTCT